MRVMSAGDGYKYLLRSVAVGDGDRSLSTPLTRYYNAEGTPPGRWMGSGLPALGTGQIRSGDVVSEAQLQLLVGMGRDPVTGAPLGRAYPVYKTVEQRIDECTATLNPHVDPAARARAISAIEANKGAESGSRRDCCVGFGADVAADVAIALAFTGGVLLAEGARMFAADS